jgi:hypothetical protein
VATSSSVTASRSVAAARHAYAALAVDRSYSAGALDLKTRERTSLFPWRGQFSPDLVRLLLARFDCELPVLDPFMGSGTVLFESLRAGRPCAGAEINPAAFVFARLAEVAARPRPVRARLLRTAQRRITAAADDRDWVASLADIDQGPVRQILEASYLLARGNSETCDATALARAFDIVRTGLLAIDDDPAEAIAVAEDARHLPFDTESFGLVITSPPYINVFNYHQQFRGAAEALGYQPLRIAGSEIGANRKHRGNRLLTVIQYCLDLSMAIDEIARVLAPGGHLVLVIGRESRVRGIAFDNGALAGALINVRPDLTLDGRSERKFTSRFGEVIYEDLLFVRRTGAGAAPGDQEFARSVGVHALRSATRSRSLDADVRADLDRAIAQAAGIEASPRVVPELAGLRSAGARTEQLA